MIRKSPGFANVSMPIIFQSTQKNRHTIRIRLNLEGNVACYSTEKIPWENTL